VFPLVGSTGQYYRATNKYCGSRWVLSRIQYDLDLLAPISLENQAVKTNGTLMLSICVRHEYCLWE